MWLERVALLRNEIEKVISTELFLAQSHHITCAHHGDIQVRAHQGLCEGLCVCVSMSASIAC